MKLVSSVNPGYLNPMSLSQLDPYLRQNQHLPANQNHSSINFLSQNSPENFMDLDLPGNEMDQSLFFNHELQKFSDTGNFSNGNSQQMQEDSFGSDSEFVQAVFRNPRLKPTQTNLNGLNGSVTKLSKKSKRSCSPTALIKQLTGSSTPLASIDEIDKRYLANLTREERRRVRRATVKYRTAHASRERLRVEAFSIAFTELRKLLPTLPHDKKLSKIEILRLAIAYISYLDHLLASTA